MREGSERKSPIRQMDLPGRERALVRRQIDREHRDLVGLAEPSHRLAVDEGLLDGGDRLAAQSDGKKNSDG